MSFSLLPPSMCGAPSARMGLAVLAMAVVSACARRAAPEDAGRIVRAIELLREAPNQEKEPRLKSLAAEPCSTEDVCGLQRQCISAYELHVHALEMQRAVSHGMGDDAGAPPLMGLGALLQRAEEELRRARDAAERCATEEARLRERYRI